MIFEMAGAGTKFRSGLAVLIETMFAKADVGFLIVAREIEIVLNERGAQEGVVADTISADPGIEHGQGEEKEEKEKALRFART